MHNWGSIPASERAQRCRTCGGKGHRSSECRAGLKVEEKAKYKAPPPNPKGTPQKGNTANAPVTATAVPSPKEMSQQQIKSMLADAAQILQQAVPSPATPTPPAVPISPAPTPGNTGSSPVSPVTHGTPVTLEALNAQIESLRAYAQEHELKMLGMIGDNRDNLCDREVQVKALLDSGATHAVVPFKGEMKDLERVGVTLAGDLKEEWFKTSGGTLVVPPPVDGAVAPKSQTILPFGALVQTLGCKVTWSKRGGLKVVHPRLGPLKVGVSSNTCPYVQEDQALSLIAELEAKKLREFEQSVQAMQAELHQLSAPVDPTESIQKYIANGDRTQLLRAVFAQPYLGSVPEAVKVKLCEELPGLTDSHGWQLLKRLPLSRARRRALHASRQWVVSLCSGPVVESDPLKQWAHGRNLEYLGIDIQEPGGKGWDLSTEGGVWSVLLWAAAQGRVVTILSSPPYRTWYASEGATNARQLRDPWGLSTADDLVFKENLLAVQDMVLWSIASVARGCAIPFLKEVIAAAPHASPGDQVVRPESFWKTEVWSSFQQWAKVRTFNFCQGSLGHEWLRPSIIGTNLALSHLQGLPPAGSPNPRPGGSSGAISRWCIGFKKEVVEALDGKVKGPSIDELDAVITQGLKRKTESGETTSSESSTPRDDEKGDSLSSIPDVRETLTEVNAVKPAELEAWRAHIMRGHLPYRRDCQFCIEGSGLGVQHRRVKNPQAFTLSVDLFGPVPPTERGRDEQSVSGNPHLKFGLIGVYRMPKSMIATIKFSPPSRASEEETQQANPFDELPGAPEEYVPSEPGIDPGNGLLGDIDDEVECVIDPTLSHIVDAVEGQDGLSTEEGDPVETYGNEAYEWIDDEGLEIALKEATNRIEMVTLRFFVGLKSKTGPDVTAGIQQIILRITQRFPLRVLHCDPGTEFTSEALMKWLPGQGVKLQTTIPTDKQGNGLAERVVGWFKSRARTLLAANDLPALYWPVAMRWAAEAHNRAVLLQDPLPAFGQVVLHKLKKPAGGHKELITRWVKTKYGAPHLTVTDGHVLITQEGNLVASRGFRTGAVDAEALKEAQPPPLQEDEAPSEEEELIPDGELPLVPPERRLREKTTIRFVEGDLDEDHPEDLARIGLLDDNFSNEHFRRLVAALEGRELPTADRRGELQGRFVLGAYGHGGQRGVTTLCKSYPKLTLYLNKFLKGHIQGSEYPAEWATILLVHASDVPIHRDYRNEWNTRNFALCVPGVTELWKGPPHNGRPPDSPPAPDWDSAEVTVLTDEVKSFDPRCYHAVRRSPDWVIVGYSPLGVHKLKEVDRSLLTSCGFSLPTVPGDECQVKVVRPNQSKDDEHLRPPWERPTQEENDGPPPWDQGPLQSDEQPDSNTQLVGWDLSAGATRNSMNADTLPSDLHLFLWQRDIVYLQAELRRLGVEEPEDLIYLYPEDLIEFGLSRWEAERVMFGVHPSGTRRPDNPNNSGLRTGEVRLYDRDNQQIPWVMQNRTLAERCPGPPLPNLGVRTNQPQNVDPSRRWHELDQTSEPPRGSVGRSTGTNYYPVHYWEDEWPDHHNPEASSSSASHMNSGQAGHWNDWWGSHDATGASSSSSGHRPSGQVGPQQVNLPSSGLQSASPAGAAVDRPVDIQAALRPSRIALVIQNMLSVAQSTLMNRRRITGKMNGSRR